MHPVHRYRKLTEVNTLLGMVCQHVRVPDRRTTSVAHCGSSALIEKKKPHWTEYEISAHMFGLEFKTSKLIYKTDTLPSYLSLCNLISETSG